MNAKISETSEAGVKSASRRRLLKAGWIVPVIVAVTPPATLFAVQSGPGDDGHGHGHGGEEGPHRVE